MSSSTVTTTTISDDSSPSSTSRLLVLLIDGLRWDVVANHLENNTNEFGFKRLQKNGAYLQRLTPVFPAECYPNIYSLFTGRHPVDHGVILPTTFSEHTTIDGEPIRSQAEGLWETGVKQNKGVHLYHLPICSNEAGGENSWHCEPYNQELMNPMNLNVTIQKALNGLQNGSAHLAVVYYDELDRIGHRYGPLSNELVHKHLIYLDYVIDYALNIIESIPNLNLLLTSDHGMATVSHRAYADRYFKTSQLSRVLNRGSTLWIWPKPGYERDVYDRLLIQQTRSPFTVYNSSTIPSHWKTITTSNNASSHHSLFPPILMIASSNYIFHSNAWPLNMSHYNLLDPKGMHGYDPEHTDMHIPLFIYGPNSNRGVQLNFTKEIRPMHIHALMAYLATINLPDFHSLNLFTPLLLSQHQHPHDHHDHHQQQQQQQHPLSPVMNNFYWSLKEKSSTASLFSLRPRNQLVLMYLSATAVIVFSFAIIFALIIYIYMRCHHSASWWCWSCWFNTTRAFTCHDELNKELVKSPVLSKA